VILRLHFWPAPLQALAFVVNPKLVTRSQLLEGFKCESQTKNKGIARSWGMLPGSQHFGGVEGCVGALGWD